MLRRPQIQADNVGRFAFELGIVAGQVTALDDGVSGQLLSKPDAQRPADSERCRQFAATPSVEPSLGFLRVADRIRARKAGVRTWPSAGMIGIEPIESGLEEALLPADDGGSTGLQPALNGIEGGSFCQHQDELGAKRRSRPAGYVTERCC